VSAPNVLHVPDGLPFFVGEQWHRVAPMLDAIRNDEVLVALEPDGNTPIRARAVHVDELPRVWRDFLAACGLLPLPRFPAHVLLSVRLTGELGADLLKLDPRRSLA
jgi:hypothetical protein